MIDKWLGRPFNAPVPSNGGYGRMAGCLFTCPVTDLKVQHWLDDDEDVPENEHEAITCEACARLHLINQGLADF